MSQLTGTSKEMEDQAKAMTDQELAEIAWKNDSPPALKARGEIARRNGKASKSASNWALVAGVTGILAVVLAAVSIAIQLVGS